MPNIKSSIKSMKVDAKRRARNIFEKTRMKKAQKLVLAAIAAGDAAEAKKLLPAAHKLSTRQRLTTRFTRTRPLVKNPNSH